MPFLLVGLELAFVDGPAAASLPRPPPLTLPCPPVGVGVGSRLHTGQRLEAATVQLLLPPAQRWAGRPLSPSVSRPFCGAGAEAVLRGDAPGSGRVQRGPIPGGLAGLSPPPAGCLALTLVSSRKGQQRPQQALPAPMDTLLPYLGPEGSCSHAQMEGAWGLFIKCGQGQGSRRGCPRPP